MMYFDNAATTYPKPTTVNQAVERALRLYGANPGRAGHAMSMRTAEEIYQTRSEIAEFFNAAGPECGIYSKLHGCFKLRYKGNPKTGGPCGYFQSGTQRCYASLRKII